jgi:hypothetical protein
VLSSPMAALDHSAAERAAVVKGGRTMTLTHERGGYRRGSVLDKARYPVGYFLSMAIRCLNSWSGDLATRSLG